MLFGRDHDRPRLTVPYHDPPVRGLGVIQATLRIVVAVQCWGTALGWLHQGASTPLQAVLEKEFYLDSVTTAGVESIMAYVLVAVGFLSLVRPIWLLSLALALWAVLLSGCAAWTAGGLSLRTFTHTLHWVAPVGLIVVDFWPPPLEFSIGRFRMAISLLRLGAAVSFMSTGMFVVHHACQGSHWTQAVQALLTRLHGPTALPPDTILGIAGSLHLGFGLALLLHPSRTTAWLAAVWATGAMLLPTLAQGVAGYHQTLTHVGDPGVALALGMAWSLAHMERPGEWIPAP